MNEINALDRRSALQIQCDVIQALFVRELKTRFGKSRLGYFWTVAEPICLIVFHATFLIVRNAAAGRSTPLIAGIEMPLFFMTGIVPFFFFRNVVRQITHTVEANRVLFSYQQVKPMDSMIARLYLECIIYLSVYIILIVIAWLSGYHMPMHNPLGLISIYTIFTLMSFSLGAIACVASHFYHDTTRIVHVIMYPLYFISGNFFTLESIPEKYWPLIIWNPVLHSAELSRSMIFEQFIPHQKGSLIYLLSFTGITLFFAFLLYRLYRREVGIAS